MSRLRKNNDNLSGTLAGTLSPKMIMAAVLLIVMAALWLRVFLRGRSGPAKAYARNVQTAQNNPAHSQTDDPAIKPIPIRPVLLPVVPGRHDRLQINPFVLDRSRWFRAAEDPRPCTDGVSQTNTDEQKHRANLQKISQRLVLEAIVKDADGVPIKACVDGTVLFKGSIIKLKENGEIYDLKVTEICATEIKLEWQVFTLTIKMPSSEWLD